MPFTRSRFCDIQTLWPMITLGIWERYSRVDTIETRPPFLVAMFTSPGVQVTAPWTQYFSTLPVWVFLRSSQ